MQRTTFKKLGILLAIAVAVLMPGRAWSWGCQGHQTVALIAQKHLSAKAKTKVFGLIGNPDAVIGATKRFCGVDGLTAIANVSTWADDVRDDKTGGWHFLDVNRGADRHAVASFCPAKGCVTSAIEEQLGVLRDATKPKQDRAEALMYVIHFVGDLHQPLHCTTNHDRGGNCVPVDFFGEHTKPDTKKDHGDYTVNLHGVWDRQLVLRAMGTSGVEALATRLNAKFQADMDGWKAGSLEDWAWESHGFAEPIVYGKLSTPIPVDSGGELAQCDEGNISKHLAALHEKIGQSYADAAVPVVEEQLAKAGARLAKLLNDVWP